MRDNCNTTEVVNIEAITRSDRWEIYRRLQELEINCFCTTNCPLQVQIDTPTAAIQLWSVARRFTTPRRRLANWLDTCWQVNIEDYSTTQI